MSPVPDNVTVIPSKSCHFPREIMLFEVRGLIVSSLSSLPSSALARP